MSTQPWQLRATISRILLLTIVAFFAVVHGIALHRMDVVNAIGRSTPDTTLPGGD
jgi:hypothetical protein